MKKIIVVGATGRLGSVVVGGLKDYEVIRAGRSGPDLKIDALDFESVSAAFATIGPFDALISCAGVRAPFKPFEELTMEDFAVGISNKCLSQLNLAKAAIPYLTENGSITLTSGIIGDEPILSGSAAAAANGALNMCVSTLAAEYAGRLRINIVSSSRVYDGQDENLVFNMK